MALIVKTDGTKTEVKGKEPNGSLSYAQLQEICQGYIQAVECDPKVTDGYDHFYCNEEGKLTGMVPNAVASLMSTYTADNDIVVGDVVFCKSNGEGDSF
jgi:hypothetical protein